ncbi:hypothetical protein GW17_00007477 [Ensete ventricosum]|nr:hypothetical protein GW17_00007477 [Ensete ventricosum]
MYTVVAEEGSNGMEQEMVVVVFNLLLAAFKIVGSERLLGRQQIDGSVTWWVTVDGGNVKSNCGNCLEDGGAEMATGQQGHGSDTK